MIIKSNQYYIQDYIQDQIFIDNITYNISLTYGNIVSIEVDLKETKISYSNLVDFNNLLDAINTRLGLTYSAYSILMNSHLQILNYDFNLNKTKDIYKLSLKLEMFDRIHYRSSFSSNELKYYIECLILNQSIYPIAAYSKTNAIFEIIDKIIKLLPVEEEYIYENYGGEIIITKLNNYHKTDELDKIQLFLDALSEVSIEKMEEVYDLVSKNKKINNNLDNLISQLKLVNC